MKLVLVVSVLLNCAVGNVDWRDTSWLSPPTNQLGCGSCYSFAAVALLESFTNQLTGKEISFSQQYYVDCFGSDGCAGGSLKDTLQNVEETQYQAYLEDYGFTGYFEEQVCIDGGFYNRTARNALADVWLLKFEKLAASDAALETALNRGPTAMDQMVSSEVFDWDDKNNTEPIVDDTCGTDQNAHSWSFVGYTDDAYIIKGSYGADWAGDGYAMYAKTGNTACGYLNYMYTIYMTKRRSIEYQIGSGRLKYEDAQAYCIDLDTDEKSGWTLAIMPTRMHIYEVYDMFVEKFGSDTKTNAEFNYFWIGIRDAMSDSSEMMFIDGETPVTFQWFSKDPTKKFVKMAKFNKNSNANVRGRWQSESKTVELRFMCSRFRAEKCSRISQTAVDNADTLKFYNSTGGETLEINSGTTAAVTCISGYELSGSNATCQDSGSWSELPACTEIPEELTCDKFWIKNMSNKKTKIMHEGSKITNQDEIPDGAKAVVKCNAKSTLNTSGTTLCTDGAWTNIPTCDKKKRKKKEV